ncbi:MAG: hypothetical protein ONB44_03975 [candidate division KSB1 bacterium]|nr:hypothetical protein [candidate division KSB1 bacterium]MDZ7301288.1 hypothetical protein [candidate division KSB1 bacterium]MDZ7310827.1 hypothetical protein [candidate division KSB1 bacterium]
MTPLHPAFRRLLRWFIPQLKNEELDRLDGLLALRHHLIIEKGIGKTPIEPAVARPKSATDPDIEQLTRQANAILSPYKNQYERVLRLWTARRELVLRQDKFLPTLTNLRLKDLQLIGNYGLNYGLLLAHKLPFVAKVRKLFVSKTQKPSD